MPKGLISDTDLADRALSAGALAAYPCTMPTTTLATPIGTLTLTADDLALVDVAFDRRWRRGSAPESAPMPVAPELDRDERNAVLHQACAELAAYFEGRLAEFTVALAPQGTPFQQGCWRALCDLPYGSTASYRDVAVAVGNPAAVRAVGAANGRNPIPIIIPCHRVIGSDGSLTGFGGGLDTKRWLLAHEARHRPALVQAALQAELVFG